MYSAVIDSCAIESLVNQTVRVVPRPGPGFAGVPDEMIIVLVLVMAMLLGLAGSMMAAQDRARGAMRVDDAMLESAGRQRLAAR